jgi:hypothetical protein
LQTQNKTLELTQQLIPLLKAEGYKFVRLDEIDSIKKASTNQLSVTLKTSKGKLLNIDQNNTIATASFATNSDGHFIIKDVGLGLFALQAPNGLFWTCNTDSGSIIQANKKQIGDCEKFAVIPVFSNKIMLRAFTGYYLQLQNHKTGILTASAEYMRGAQIFTIMPLGITPKKHFSLSSGWDSLKRKGLFIKSKIKQKYLTKKD